MEKDRPVVDIKHKTRRCELQTKAGIARDIMKRYYPLTFASGSVIDAEYRKPKTCILYSVNSIMCKPFGVCKALHDKYAHEDAVTSRRSLTFVSRARRIDRDMPGEIILQRSPDETSPHLIALVTQFGYGDPYNDDVDENKKLAASTDYHYVNERKEDTEDNRLKHFQACIKKIIIFALGCEDLDTIVLPNGIGNRGLCNNLWKTKYLPVIQNMASRLQMSKIKVIVLTLDRKTS